jgi:hypothetical protein
MESVTKQVALWLVLLCLSYPSKSQSTLGEYLRAHQYAFSLTQGFDGRTGAMLTEKLAPYKLVLEAEGGSHFLTIYEQLHFTWLKFLNENFGTIQYFRESGNSTAVVYNEYFRTGDTSFLFFPRRKLWTNLYAYNQSLPETKRIANYGIDFDGPWTYVKALQLILPATAPPPGIADAINQVKKADLLSDDCDYIIGINKILKRSLEANRQSYIDFLEKRYNDFERIVTNGATCKDTRKDRNPNLAANFLSFDKVFNQRMYYASLGSAHTDLSRRVTAASIINHSEQFKGKICVVNLFCDNCSTPEEGLASNWTFREIEKEVAAYFLPLCTSDFTLFDLTGDDPLIKKFASHGQFLIIARNQK